MQKCPHCSAPLQDEVEQCTFCGNVTSRGVEARQARATQSEVDRRAAEQRAVGEAAAARSRAQPEVDSAGKWALLSSLIGTVLCCLFPIGPVMGIVFGLRARRLALQHGLPGATMGTAGLALGVLGVVLSVALWIAMVVLGIQEDKHKAALTAQLQQVTAATLELKTACVLTELEMIATRHAGFTSMEDFQCTASGDLAQDGDEAVLRDTHFMKDGKKVEVFACLRYRSRWSVHQLRDDEDCSAPKQKKPEHE